MKISGQERLAGQSAAVAVISANLEMPQARGETQETADI
jgi:hypothetical protein